MRNTNQSEEPKKAHHQQIECNIEKCWIRMGIVTVTLLTGFTFSMAVTGVQAAATQETNANVVSSSSEAPASSSSDEKDQLKNDQSPASSSSDTSISKASSTTSSSQSSSSEQSSGTSDASSIGSSSSSSAGASSQSNANKPATDVNGHSLKFDSSSNQKTADSSSETKTVNDKTATQTADVKKDADGNYWLPVADETTGVNTYTQLTDYTYTQNVDSSTYTVTGYTGDLQKYLAGGTTPENGYATDITIPDTYNGNNVTAIGDNAFDNKDGDDPIAVLTKVTIGKNITTIGNNAFTGNDIKGEIVIPDTVTSIGDNAFANNQISGTVKMPFQVSIGDNAFANNQITGVVMGNNTWFTGNGTFANNLITSLDLGTGVTLIGKGAFENNRLTTLTLPDQVGTINDNAFQNNKSLTTINFSQKGNLTQIGTSAFESDALTAVALPSSVINIGDRAFTNNQITTWSLGYHTLSSDYKNGQTIGTSAFANNKISIVDIPDSVINVGDNAFANNQIKALTLGTSVQTIGTNAFTSNQISGSVDIPDKVTGIGDDAFANNQINALTLGTAVKTIGTNAFLNNKISGTVIVPDSVTELGAYAFMNNEISGVSLSNKLTKINIYTFANNKLTNQLVIPDAVTNIGDSAFANNEITSLTLDENLQTIDDNAFANNHISGEFTVLGSVYAIGENAFLNNQISELVLDKVNAGINQTIATNAFAQNKISQVINNSKNDSDDYLSNQQATVTVNALATATQIEDIRTIIENKVGITLPEVLTFTDNAGKQWQYDSQADTLTIPSGETMPNQVTFKFSSVGSASYGTNDLVVNLQQQNSTGPAVAATTTTVNYETPDGKVQGSAQLVGTPGTPFDRYQVLESVPAGWQLAVPVRELPLIIAQDTNQTVIIPLVAKTTASTGPAVAATTTTVNYETPDGKVQGSAQLVGTPGTPFDRYQVQEYVPAGWQLAVPVRELPLIIAQDTNQTVIIPLVVKNTASSGPTVAATTTTVNYETPDGTIQGSAQLVGTPGTPFDRYQVQEYVPAGWQLAVSVSELPLIIAQDTNQTVVVPLAAQTGVETGPAVEATTTTVKYETPDGVTRGYITLIGEPGYSFGQDEIMTHKPADWQLAVPVDELPQLVAQTGNQTIVIPLAAQTKTKIGPVAEATTTTINYETPDGVVRGTATLVGNPGTPFDRYQVLAYVPTGWQLAVPVSELPLIIAQATNQTVIIPLVAQDDTVTPPARPGNGNGGGSTTTTGQSNGQVPTDPEQPNSSTDNGGAVTSHTRPSTSTSDPQAGQGSAGEQSSVTATDGLHEDSNSGRAVEVERTVQTARLTTSKHQTGSSKARLPQLPQTDETTPTQPTLIGGLLLSILGWFGLARRKHEKD